MEYLAQRSSCCLHDSCCPRRRAAVTPVGTLLSLIATGFAVLGWAAIYAPIALDSVARQAAAVQGQPAEVVDLYDRFAGKDLGLWIAFGFFIVGHVIGTALVGV